MLPEGHRLHVVLEGILVELGSLTPQAAAFLEGSVRAGLNILVTGGTQAGKPTMLNCLAAAVPGGERVVSAEEVYELRFPHPDHVALQTRQSGLEGTGEIRLRDLVKETLRMRPSRIIVGEVRSEECLDLVLALNSGLPGMCTLHANSAREALVKMCTLPLLAGENISDRFVVPTVASSVDLVVHLGPAPPRALRAGRPRRAPPAGGGRLMGALVGLGVGTGLLLVWSAFAVPRVTRPAPRGPGRLARTLAAAGLVGVSPTALLALCVAGGLSATLVVQIASGTPTVALAFGFIAAYLPLAVVRGRAVRRQRELAEVWPDAVDNLASAVRAGMSLPDALAALGVRGPAPLRDAFTAFGLDYQVSGRFGEACASPATSAAATWGGCCATSRATCATTHAPAPSSRRARPGPSTVRGSRSRRPGWCC